MTAPASPSQARAGARAVLLHMGDVVPAWAGAAGAVCVPLGRPGDPSGQAQAGTGLAGVLAGAECVLLDADTLDPLAVARRVYRAAPEAQVVIVVGTEARRRALERALVFTPGVGELWLASPEDVGGGITERAAGVTRQRRRFRRTRERIERERIEASPQRSERALVSDAYLANLLQVLPDPVFSIDPAGRILSANTAAGRVLRAAGPDPVGAPLSTALGADDALVARALDAAADRPSSATVTFRCADGSAGHGELLVARVAGSEPALFAVVLHDHTERHRAQQRLEEQAAEVEAQAEELQATVAELEAQTEQAVRANEALAESERQFRTLADAIPTLAWTARADGYLDWYNAQWYAYTGTTFAEMEGWGWQRVHDPAVLPDVLARWQTSIATGEPFEMTFPLRRADGRFRAFLTRVTPVADVEGRVVRWFGTSTDVEAEREARAAAEAAEVRLRGVFEQAPTAIAVLSGPEHVYTIVSPLYARSPGGGRPLLGRSIREAFPELEGTGYPETMDRVYETGVPFSATERQVFLDRGDGVREARYFNVGYQPLRDAAGAVYAIASVAYDITDQVSARREVEAARAEAERQRATAEAANRAKSEFLSTMSHELRTPLNAIQGYTELLALGVRGPVTAEQALDLERVRRANQHLMSLITDILNFARLEAGQVEYHLGDVSIAPLVADVESLVGPQLAAKGLTFDGDVCTSGSGAAEAPGRAHVVRGDPEKLRQILLNLLTNAIKFTDAGGHVTLACETDAAAGVVRLRVTDTGRGIPAGQRERIFEPFVQVDRHRTQASQQGVGLGLAISRDLARGMGGDLTVESTPDVGSTFTLTLPRA